MTVKRLLLLPLAAIGLVACDNTSSGYSWDGVTLLDGDTVIGSVTTVCSDALTSDIDITEVGEGLYKITARYPRFCRIAARRLVDDTVGLLQRQQLGTRT